MSLPHDEARIFIPYNEQVSNASGANLNSSLKNQSENNPDFVARWSSHVLEKASKDMTYSRFKNILLERSLTFIWEESEVQKTPVGQTAKAAQQTIEKKRTYETDDSQHQSSHRFSYQMRLLKTEFTLNYTGYGHWILKGRLLKRALELSYLLEFLKSAHFELRNEWNPQEARILAIVSYSW